MSASLDVDSPVAAASVKLFLVTAIVTSHTMWVLLLLLNPCTDQAQALGKDQVSRDQFVHSAKILTEADLTISCCSPFPLALTIRRTADYFYHFLFSKQ